MSNKILIESPRISDAIQAIKQDAVFSTVDDTITWHDGNPTNITTEEISEKLVELQETFTKQEYARIRRIKYNDLNQFEMQFDDEVNGTTTWKDAILKIKSDNPKE